VTTNQEAGSSNLSGRAKFASTDQPLSAPALPDFAPKPGGCGSFAGLCLANLVRGLHQAREFRLGVVRRDATTTMPEQILTILERHTRRAESAAEGVFKIVNPNLPKPLRCCFLDPSIRRALPSRLPRRVVNFRQRLWIASFGFCVYEYIHGIRPANNLPPGLERIVQTAQAVQHDWLMTREDLESQGLGGMAAD
jgi:hypothetical protein